MLINQKNEMQLALKLSSDSLKQEMKDQRNNYERLLTNRKAKQ